MILYCIVCYLVVFGILLKEHEHFDECTEKDIICFIFSPIVAPIVLGMSINNKEHEK